MVATHIHDRGGRIIVENGYLILDGPGSVAVTLTAEAAADIGGRLCAAAEAAMGERLDPDTSETDAETEG